jgi:hypothetical protein
MRIENNKIAWKQQKKFHLPCLLLFLCRMNDDIYVRMTCDDSWLE